MSRFLDLFLSDASFRVWRPAGQVDDAVDYGLRFSYRHLRFLEKEVPSFGQAAVCQLLETEVVRGATLDDALVTILIGRKPSDVQVDLASLIDELLRARVRLVVHVSLIDGPRQARLSAHDGAGLVQSIRKLHEDGFEGSALFPFVP